MLPSHVSKTPRTGLRFVAQRAHLIPSRGALAASPLLAREEILASGAKTQTATLLTEWC